MPRSFAHHSFFNPGAVGVCLVAADGTMVEANRHFHTVLEGAPSGAGSKLQELARWLDDARRLVVDGVALGTISRELIEADLTLIEHGGELVTEIRVRRVDVDSSATSVRRRPPTAAESADSAHLLITLRSIAEGIIATDERGLITLMNPVAETLTGWTQEWAQGNPVEAVFRLVEEETSRPVEGPERTVLSDGGSTSLPARYVLVGRGGEQHAIAHSASPIRGPNGEVAGMVIVFRDCSEERRAEAEIERAKQELTDLIAKLPIGVVVSRGARVVGANPAMAKLLGYASPSDMVGRGANELVAAVDQGAAEEYQKRIRQRAPLDGRVWRARRADGSTVLVETAPARDIEFGGERATLWVVRDLTEFDAIRTKLAEADRLASLGMLAAGVAHEINNPLSFLSASLEYVEEVFAALAARLTAAERDDVGRLLRDARAGASRVRAVARDLKMFSRSDVERARSVDVVSALDLALQMANTEIRHRARLVRKHDQTPNVRADEARLGQLFLNLIVNAAQAIPEGRASENEIRITSSTTATGWAIIEISDTGPGIPPEAVNKIFDPFFTTKPKGSGTGLGLAICQATARALGGEIRAANGAGGGATFTVVLPPVADESVGSAEPRASMVSIHPRRRGRVMVIDDEVAVGAAVCRGIARDHEVFFLDDASKLIPLIEGGERYDVIVCDLMMPQMSGCELHSRLSVTHADQAERILFLTGGAFTANARAFLEGVSNPRMNKPFDVLELRQVVSSMVK